MANADELLREAQYAFQSITYGESFANKRNAAKATALCRKIIRKYPRSMEATEAYALLRRLGMEEYSSKMGVQHRHVTQEQHHRPAAGEITPAREQRFAVDGEPEVLDWAGIARWFFNLPKTILIFIIFIGLFLFGLFGGLLFLPLIALVLFTGPLRKQLKLEQREQMDMLVARINDYVAQRS